MAQTAQTATYKGREYRCLYIGETKFGRRAHLAFRDGSKDFWVDAALVSVGAAEAPRTQSAPSRRGRNVRETYRRRYGWDGVVGSASYYTSGLYDEES